MSSSSESDREVFGITSNSSETDEEDNRRERTYRERVNYMVTLDSYEFQIRFRLDKQSVEELLIEIHPHIRVTGASLMVLVDYSNIYNRRRGGPTASGTLDNELQLRNIFFNLCKACQAETMSCIPPSSFSAGRIREAHKDMKVTNVKKDDSPTKYFQTKFMELSPLKYNSKLMNSIWGFYNRYSPHNVKKVSDYAGEMQQSAAISSGKNEPVINLPSKLDNVWTSINVSQSH